MKGTYISEENGSSVRFDNNCTYTIHEAKFKVGQLLLFRHNVLSKLEEGILVAPKKLLHRDLDEGTHFQYLHNGGHRQPQESGCVLTLRRRALKNARLEMCARNTKALLDSRRLISTQSKQ